MKKQIAIGCIAALLCTQTGCGLAASLLQSREQTQSAAEEETQGKAEATEAEDAPTQALPEETEPTSEDGTEAPASGDWHDVYRQLIADYRQDHNADALFSLDDLNADGTPELILSDGTWTKGSHVCYAFANGAGVEIPADDYSSMSLLTDSGHLLLQGEEDGASCLYFAKLRSDHTFAPDHVLKTIWAGDESSYELDDESVDADTYYDAFYEYSGGFSKYLGEDFPLDDAVVDAVLREDLPWADAYSAFLISQLPEEQEDPEWGPAFSLYDLNADGTPELFYSQGLYHAAGVQILTYRDGLRSLGHLGSYGEVAYFPVQKRLLSTYSGMGYTTGSYLALGEDLVLQEVLTYEDNEGAVDPDSDEQPMYKLAGQPVTGEAYRAMLDGFVTGEALTLGREIPLTKEAALDPETAAAGTPAAENEDDAQPAAQLPEAFREVVESFYYGGYLQGVDLEILTDGDISGNEFALCDVDGDGAQELIVKVTTTAAASMIGVVYGEDADGGLHVELTATPHLTFYEGGTVTADWLHNQGPSGDLWPYMLYTYDSSTDTYTQTAAVSAWEQALEPDGYPEEADTSGTGRVYYVDTAMDGSETEPMDAEDFETWHKSLFGDGKEITPEFHPFTEDAIEALNF